jgi:hypothetical protein
LCGARVADVRVVRPHHHLRRPTAALLRQVRTQQFERLGHVGVAQVPRIGAAAEHRAVVGLGVAPDARALLRIEQLVGRGRAAGAIASKLWSRISRLLISARNR